MNNLKHGAKIVTALILGTLSLALFACSTGYKTQEYAKLPNSKVFEEEYETVWKGIVLAFEEYKLEEQDKDAGRLKTDWIYSTSNEKYIEYQVNGFPRKRYLQTRYKLNLSAEKHLGGVRVAITPEEEVEALKSDGTFDSWKEVSEFDTIRANDALRNVELKILSIPNR